MSLPTLREISIATAAHYEIPQVKLEGRETYRYYAHPRQVAYFLSYRLARKSYPDIGRYFGREHTSALHGCQAVAKRIGLIGVPDVLCDILAIASEATRLARSRAARERAGAAALHAGLSAPKVFPAPLKIAPKLSSHHDPRVIPRDWILLAEAGE